MPDVRAPNHPARREPVEERSIQRSAGLVSYAGQEKRHQEPGGSKGKRDGHVAHRALSGLHTRLTENLKAVTHRLDAGKGTASKTECPQKNDDGREKADLRSEEKPSELQS